MVIILRRCNLKKLGSYGLGIHDYVLLKLISFIENNSMQLSNYMGNVKFMNKKCAKFMPSVPSLQAGKGSVKTPALCQANCKESP